MFFTGEVGKDSAGAGDEDLVSVEISVGSLTFLATGQAGRGSVATGDESKGGVATGDECFAGVANSDACTVLVAISVGGLISAACGDRRTECFLIMYNLGGASMVKGRNTLCLLTK